MREKLACLIVFYCPWLLAITSAADGGCHGNVVAAANRSRQVPRCTASLLTRQKPVSMVLGNRLEHCISTIEK